MKTINWNLGLLIITLGEKIRKYWYGNKPKISLRYEIGSRIMRFGYWLRGDVPQKLWKITTSVRKSTY